MHQITNIIYELLFIYVVFYKYPIYWGMASTYINAYFLSKDVFFIEKYAGLEQHGDLMNRLIHRSWGENFVNIFLDLSINIYCAHPEPEGNIGSLVFRSAGKRKRPGKR